MIKLSKGVQRKSFHVWGCLATDIIKIIEKERNRLQKKYEYHRGCHRDTGYDRYYNLMDRYENELWALEQLQTRIEQAQSQDHIFNSLLNDLSAKVTSLRLDYPHDDALLYFQIYLRERRERWEKMLRG